MRQKIRQVAENKPVQHQFLFIKSARDLRFVKLFRWLLALEISNDARVIFALMFDAAQGSDTLQISYRNLALMVNDSQSRIRRGIDELIEVGLLTRKTEILKNGVHGTPIYTISQMVFRESFSWTQPKANSQDGYAAGDIGGMSPVTYGVSPATQGYAARDIHGMSPVTPTVCHGRHPYKKKTIKKTTRAGGEAPNASLHNVVEALAAGASQPSFDSDYLLGVLLRPLALADWEWLQAHVPAAWIDRCRKLAPAAPLPSPKQAAIAANVGGSAGASQVGAGTKTGTNRGVRQAPARKRSGR